MSNLKLKATPANYAEALEFLGGRVSKKLGHNTDIVHYGKNIRVLYHGNVIATYYRDAGNIQHSTEIPVVAFRTAGWDTVTTCNRITMLLQASMARVDNSTYRAGVGIKQGQAELRTWRIDSGKPDAAQTLGDSAVNVYKDGYVGVKVDVEGQRQRMRPEKAAELLPY